jgi:hypothetical protein
MNDRPARRNPWGTIFLLFAAGGFALFTLQPWWPAESIRFFRAFFEASLVGALADWFAVTALFRRPLGLPLPHTDLLVRRKDQLVQALPRFFGSFLEPESLTPVLKKVDWAQLVLDHGNASVWDALAEEGVQALWNSPDRPAWEQKAIGLIADVLYRELAQHKDALVGPLTEMIKQRVGWKRLFVQRETIEEAAQGFLDELKAVGEQETHGLRRYLLEAFHDAWPRLAEMLRPSRWTAGTWKRLETDPDFRLTFNGRAAALVVTLWERVGASAALTSALGYLLAQTDARNLADRIEGAVRNDLQYIRVNGALVGGMAGLLLELLKFSR